MPVRCVAVACAAVLVVVLVACTPPAPPGVAPVPPPEPGTPLLPAPLDCARWRYDGLTPAPFPAEWDSDDYRFGSARHPRSAGSPHLLCGQTGAAVDLAWTVDRGGDDVQIAVLDSGIRWRDRGAMADLAEAAHLNRGELPIPLPPVPDAAGSDPYDHDRNGRFTATDYSEDPRVGDRNANEVIDPEDLILSPDLSDGVDDDGNGYVDDISGWDFLNDDNDPLDDVDYGHGTGEARDSTAAHNGTGDAGMCDGCRFIPVRVADSFIADGGRFAAGVLFAVDSGADVVQEALGAINNPPQAQLAIDAAHRRGVPVIASMADEQSAHPNLPAALNHTIPVNSVTLAGGPLSAVGDALGRPVDALAVNGCTNTGAYAWLSVPSDSCSSEATGNAAGMTGLVESAARRGGVAPHPDLAAAGLVGPGRNVLSADEVAQILRATADDIDFSSPNAVDPANDFTDPAGQQRYPTVKGRDATHGYGRINAYEAVKAAHDGEIPPEADLIGPVPFAPYDTSGTLEVRGRVAAVRSSTYSYRVEWATGVQPPLFPGGDTWHPVAQRTGLDAPVSGDLASIDLATVAAALPDAATGPPATSDGRPDPDRFTVRVRVVVTDADGRVGTTERPIQVHHDPDLVAVDAPPGLGTASPVFADLDGDGARELIAAGDDGLVHALRPDGAEAPGFPARTGPAPFWHPASPTAAADDIAAPSAAVMVGAPAIADLDTDGRPDLVVSDLEGGVHVIAADGSTLATMHTDPTLSDQHNTDERNRAKPGFAGSPALGDLDGDGALEIIGAAMDRHVYVWHADGTPMAGFPVLVVDPDQVAAVEPTSHRVTFRDPGSTDDGGELVATPALGDLDGDGRPEIVVGAQEQYLDEELAVWPPISLGEDSGNTRLYAISPDGTQAHGPNRNPAHPDEQAYLPGWPARLPMLLTSVLPTIGNGVAAQAAIGDVDGDGGPDVVATSVAGQTMVLKADGTSTYERFGLRLAPNWLGATSGASNSTDTGALLTAFGGPAVGRLDRSGQPTHPGLDIASPTTGARRALDTLLPNRQAGDPQLTAWSGHDGVVRDGFPRVTADIAFFVTPAIADVDGDGASEVVAGNGVQMLDAVGAGGRVPDGWPKLTGGWLVGTPSVGDWDGDGRAEVAVVRRDGPLLVWRTPTGAETVGDWPRFGGNDHNDGTGRASRP